MFKAKALAIQNQSFGPAAKSAVNTIHKIIDFMYGTEERVKVTYVFSLALIVLGMFMNNSNASSLAVCAL